MSTVTKTELCKVPFIYEETESLLRQNGITCVEDLMAKNIVHFVEECRSNPENRESDRWKLLNAISMVREFGARENGLVPPSDFVSHLMSIPGVARSTVNQLASIGITSSEGLGVSSINDVAPRAQRIVFEVLAITPLTPENAAKLWSDALAICTYTAYGYWEQQPGQVFTTLGSSPFQAGRHLPPASKVSSYQS
jgi:hypothetical protein